MERSAVTPADVAEITGLAENLIRIPGHEEYPGKERDRGIFLCEWLRVNDVEVELQEVSDGRANVVACVKGRGGGPSLMLNGHLDTIPPYGMAEALTPRIREGKLYGRGAADMLGALAVMAFTLVKVRREGVQLRGDLLFSAVIGEESGSLGAWDLVAHKQVKADYAIVGEPTRMRIATSHKGVEWLEARFEGKAAHGSSPEQGINAIYHAVSFVRQLRETYMRELATRRHPILGHSTVNVGEIKGGERPTVVAERCVVRIDRRYIPGETPESVFAEMEEQLQETAKREPEMKAVVERVPQIAAVPHPAFEGEKDSPLTEILASAYREETGEHSDVFGAHFWTDAALLSKYGGMECVICGPGNVEQAHSSEEYVELSQLALAARIYLRTATRLCGIR